MRNKRGFTIVEILAVLAVISVIGTLSVIGAGILQRNSRDAQRVETLGAIKQSIIDFQNETGRVPKEDQISWQEEVILIGDIGKVEVSGPTKVKVSELNSLTAQSDIRGTVYYYQVKKDGYILGADREQGVTDVGTSRDKYADLREN
ncbi:MAG TPA: type II secretion system protein [bacterium]|nr:type II secretion system protein [bacterium]